MGVDYNLSPVKKNPDGTTERVLSEDYPRLQPQYNHYFRLFEDNIEKIEYFARQKLDLDFLKKADASGYKDEAYKDLIFDPRTIKSTVETILKVLKENYKEFPYHYWVGSSRYDLMLGNDGFFMDKNQIQNIFGLRKGSEITVNGGWDRCYFMLTLTKDINFSEDEDKKEFCAYDIEHKPGFFKEEVRKKEKSKILIKKDSFYEYYKPVLNDIITICDYAINKNYFLKGYIS